MNACVARINQLCMLLVGISENVSDTEKISVLLNVVDSLSTQSNVSYEIHVIYYVTRKGVGSLNNNYMKR